MGGSPLDAIRNAKSRETGCHYCDKDATTSIEVRVRERGADRGLVASKTVGACEEDTVKLYQGIEKLMSKKTL